MQDSRPALVQGALQCLVGVCQLAGVQFMTRRVQTDAWPVLLNLMRHGVPQQPKPAHPSGDVQASTTLCHAAASCSCQPTPIRSLIMLLRARNVLWGRMISSSGTDDDNCAMASLVWLDRSPFNRCRQTSHLCQLRFLRICWWYVWT